MDLTQFRATVAQGAPPEGISFALQTLWWDAKGDWDRAHGCAQQDEGKTGSAVHAYLHRKEGDMRNAGGWYSRAGREPPTVSLDEEWRSLTEEMLALDAAEARGPPWMASWRRSTRGMPMRSGPAGSTFPMSASMAAP